MDSVHFKSLLIILSGVVATTTKPRGFFLFNIMKYNLLQNKYDKLCDSFINGKISLCIFQSLEYVFIRDSFLFTINLN